MNIKFQSILLKTGQRYQAGVGTTRWIQGVEAGVRINDAFATLFIPWHAVQEGYEQ